MPTYPRETTEFVSIRVTVDGQTVTEGVAFSLVAKTTVAKPRPLTWTPAVILEGKTGFMLTPSVAGDVQVWARVSHDPEVPVLDAGVVTRS